LTVYSKGNTETNTVVDDSKLYKKKPQTKNEEQFDPLPVLLQDSQTDGHQ
jgi:hypothetical protein